MKRPSLWVVAGPNGAGKTTLVGARLKVKMPVVNPDEIALALTGKPSASRADLIAAGRLASKQRADHLSARRTFAIETTLTGNSALALVKLAKSKGYKIKVVYVGLSSAAMSLARVKLRVGSGGHNVPIDDVLRRFSRSLDNLREIRMLADRLWVIDNSGDRRQFLLSFKAGQAVFVSKLRPSWLAPVFSGAELTSSPVKVRSRSR